MDAQTSNLFRENKIMRDTQERRRASPKKRT